MNTPVLRLPPPIKPRTLVRMENDDGSLKGYVTSDGRYELSPFYDHEVVTRGRGPRRWWVSDTVAKTPPSTCNSLTEFRKEHCTPVREMPWLVAGMDDGVLRVERNREAASRWAYSHAGAPGGRRLHTPGSFLYTHTYGWPGEDRGTTVFIVRADHAHHEGFDPLQQPLYPYPSRPHVRRDRER